jgi:hypothetical protein
MKLHFCEVLHSPGPIHELFVAGRGIPKNLPDIIRLDTVFTEVLKAGFDRLFLQIKLTSIDESRGIVRCVDEIERPCHG